MQTHVLAYLIYLLGPCTDKYCNMQGYLACDYANINFRNQCELRCVSFEKLYHNSSFIWWPVFATWIATIPTAILLMGI